MAGQIPYILPTHEGSPKGMTIESLVRNLLIVVLLFIWSPNVHAKVQEYQCVETLAARINSDGLVEERALEDFSLRVSVNEEELPEGSRYQTRRYENHAILQRAESQNVFWLFDFQVWELHDSPHFVGYGQIGESLRLSGDQLTYLWNDVHNQYVIRASCSKSL